MKIRHPQDPLQELHGLACRNRRSALQVAGIVTATLILPPTSALALATHTRVPRTIDFDDAYSGLRIAILGVLNLVPVIGGFLSYLGALFIPELGQSAEQRWRAYADGLVSEAVLRMSQADLTGLTDLAQLYRNAVASNDPAAIKAQSIAANTVFTALIPRFQLPTHEIVLLPFFSIAATLHLALLRDICLHGAALGFTAAYVSSLKAELTERIARYSTYTDTIFAKAILKAAQDNPHGPTPDARNQPMTAMLEAQSILQRTVMDARATWYAFDAERYPHRVAVVLHRELFTPVIGWWDAFSSPPITLPNWPAPQRPATAFRAWQRRIYGANYLTGFEVEYEDGTHLRSGELRGDMNQLELKSMHQHVSRVEGFAAAGIAGMDLHSTPGKQITRLGDGPGWPARTLISTYPRHRLSSIRSIGTAKDGAKGAVSGYVLGFQLLEPQAKVISTSAYSRIAATIAPHLLPWVMSGPTDP